VGFSWCNMTPIARVVWAYYTLDTGLRLQILCERSSVFSLLYLGKRNGIY
jgi:hypothetical protein